MKRLQIRKLKHLPYHVGTIYFIFFVLSITASVVTVNCGDQVVKKYTSCHGNKVHNINWIGGLILLQMVLLFITIESTGNGDGMVELEDGEKEEKNATMEEDEYSLREGDKFGTRDGEAYSRRSSGLEYGMKVEESKKEKKKNNKKNKAKDKKKKQAGEIEEDEMEGLDGEDEMEYAGQRERGKQAGDRKKDKNKVKNLKEMDGNVRVEIREERREAQGKKRLRICWSSMWMVSYNFVIFMGVHSSLLASRIHANISLNKYGIETCTHLGYFPFSLTSPALKDPILSEPVFLVTYLSFTIHELVIRKTENCFLIKNFFGRHYFKESVLLGAVRLLIQVLIFAGNVALVVICIMYGFGSPMHMLVAFAISMLALWINSLLAQLLELTYYGDMKASSQDYGYVWSLMCAFILWFCGFFYYVSVYGVPYKRFYLYLHAIAWALLVGLTYYKRHEVFNTSEYLDDYD